MYHRLHHIVLFGWLSIGGLEKSLLNCKMKVVLLDVTKVITHYNRCTTEQNYLYEKDRRIVCLYFVTNYNFLCI